MWKTRIIPEHEERYEVCDWCKEEITDSTSVSVRPKGIKPMEDGEMHFHDMHAGGSKGRVDVTCYEKYKKEQQRRQSR